jgi:hypothetical protein
VKDIVVLIAVVVVALGGLGWYLLPHSGFHQVMGPKPMTQAEVPAPPHAEKKVDAKTADHKTADHKARPVTPTAAVKGEAEPAPQPIPALQAIPSPSRVGAEAAASVPENAPEKKPVTYPYPVEVTSGEGRQQIFDGYGVPALAATTQDGGHLFETYVYRHDRSQTHIHLEDGRVAWVSLKDLPKLTTTAQTSAPVRMVQPSAGTVTITSANTMANNLPKNGGAARLAPGDQSDMGMVTITSEPSGAAVEINQVPAGATPVVLRVSPVGLGFTLTVTKDGFMKWMVQTVATAKPSSLHAKLTPALQSLR